MAADTQFIEILRSKLESDLGDLNALALEALAIEPKVERLQDRVRTTMRMLQLETADTDDPFRVHEFVQVHINVSTPPGFPLQVTVNEVSKGHETVALEGTFVQQNLIPEVTRNQKKKGKALDVSNKTATGVVRKILMSFHGATISLDELKRQIPQDLPFTVGSEDLYRIIPRMIKRGELIRTGRGSYRYLGDEIRRELLEED